MAKSNIKTTGFSLAKGKNLIGDDFFDVKVVDNLTIAIVCDGVGSATEGAEASKRVTKYLMNNFKNRPRSWSIEKSIKSFITSINSILYEESMVNYERPEIVTTLAMIIIEGDRLYGANVGDSRIYLQRDNIISKLSFDHLMDEDGYEGVLTQAIGIDRVVSAYYFENIINIKDRILLCSDGLYTILDDEYISQKISYGANFLVKDASKKFDDNLPDDTTAVVIDILGVNHIERLKKQDIVIPIDLKAKMIIDGYKLEKSLIQNNRTWLCSNKGKEYVLKFAPIEAIDEPTILDLYVKEAWNAKRLKAGFFPKAVIPKNRTNRYYVMEKLDGVDLKEYIKKHHLSIDDTITLAKTLLKMEQYLLKFDLVHGDIKPENIMVLNRGDKRVFKIIDFGSMVELYSINSTAGTPSYLAPERFLNSSINETTEIFSIGVTIYEALTQSFPYGEIEPFQTPKFKTPKQPNRKNKNTPEWLNSVILRSISIDDNIRYKNYSNMMYELENSDKVKPFFDKSVSIIEKNPIIVFKIGFIISMILNIILILNILK